MTATETEPIKLPPGEPAVDFDQYKIPEQEVPPREGFRARRASRTAVPKITKPKERVPASKPGEFVEPLTQMYTMIGIGTGALDMRAGHDDHTCGPTIVENAEAIAVKWDDLAQKNDQVRKALRTMLQGSAWAGVIGAHIPIALAIFSQHAPGSVPAMPGKPDTGQDPEQEQPPQQQARKRTVPGRQYKRPPVNGATNAS